MRVEISYSLLGEALNFLYGLSLKGKQSRHRTRFTKSLQEKIKAVGDEELELLKEYAGEDAEGNPNKDENGNYAVKDVEGFMKQQIELFSEHYVIDSGDASEMLKTVKEVLLNFDEEVSGKEAEIFDYLCEQFEKGAGE